MADKYYAHGKLLLTGEYAVLDGATALAIPTQKGQSLEVKPIPNEGIFWKAKTYKNSIWLSMKIGEEENDNPVKRKLNQLFDYIVNHAEKKLKINQIECTTCLEFPIEWGLGTSSTLISLLSQWSGANPYNLLDNTFGGSGYDIACSTATQAILYAKKDNKPIVNEVSLNAEWTNNAYFVYLNKKKNSREAIAHYKSLNNPKSIVKDISEISTALPLVNNLYDAQKMLQFHEKIMSEALQQNTVKQLLFSDFEGVCKSLGAWGGDFILALSIHDDDYVYKYFKEKKFNTVIPYKEMIWKQ